MSAAKADRSELARRGEEYYDRVLAGKLEPKHVGRFVAIEVESGDYALGDTQLEALDRAHAKHPDRVFYLMRVGYTAAAGIGARPRRRPSRSRGAASLPTPPGTTPSASSPPAKESAMGRTYADVEVENYNDIVRREESGNGRQRVRRLKVRALIDTGSALLCLHRDAIAKLGLIRTHTAKVRTGAGETERGIYAVARINVLGRWCSAEVMEIPDSLPPLLGYILLEALDLVIQPKTHKVVPNPESGGKWVLDLL